MVKHMATLLHLALKAVFQMYTQHPWTWRWNWFTVSFATSAYVCIRSVFSPHGAHASKISSSGLTASHSRTLSADKWLRMETVPPSFHSSGGSFWRSLLFFFSSCFTEFAPEFARQSSPFIFLLLDVTIMNHRRKKLYLTFAPLRDSVANMSFLEERVTYQIRNGHRDIANSHGLQEKYAIHLEVH